jgi:uncharacterized lipoprotein NlpE involved in copper resistance
MRWIFSSLFFSIAVCLLSCNNAGNETGSVPDTAVSETPVQPDTSKIPAADNARVSLDWAGTYKGVVPCADCEGIETSITINADSTYSIDAKYLGKGEGKINNIKGNWRWTDGFTIELEGIKDGPSKYFVAEGRIIQLDKEGKRIEGALADKYVLTKSK